MAQTFEIGSKARLTKDIWFETDSGRDGWHRAGKLVFIVEDATVGANEEYDVELTSGHHKGRRFTVAAHEIEPAKKVTV